MNPNPTYQLIIRPIAFGTRGYNVSPEQRLKALLKVLKRGYSFECVSCKEVVEALAQTTTTAPVTAQWTECYDKPLRGFIIDQSFCHPAKFSLALIERIYDHLRQGYLKDGDTVGDCFGGVGIGGLVAAYRGLNWIGCELEEKFVNLARANFELHRSKLETLGRPLPQIIQGDSRKFHELIACEATTGGTAICERVEKQHKRMDYGQSAGQIGSLKSGDLQAVISSPPYAEITQTGGKQGCIKYGTGLTRGMPAFGQYGTHPQQIGKLKGGSLVGVVSSPPFCDLGSSDNRCMGGMKTPIPKMGTSPAGMSFCGDTPGQIGNERGETYWQAMALVYRSCYQAIRRGGIIALVIKDYVSKGKRVPLCNDSARLLEHVGFTPLDRIHALLVKETVHADLFNGQEVKRKERKSFLRRLAEKKGSPPINEECVLIYRRP